VEETGIVLADEVGHRMAQHLDRAVEDRHALLVHNVNRIVRVLEKAPDVLVATPQHLVGVGMEPGNVAQGGNLGPIVN
jgi:hypothetical protein